jgi:ATP-dependent helicase/nuclease subunit A
MIEPADTADDDVPDVEARERALDPQRSIILQAPAGSGKTTVLTQRFLRLLCTVEEPEQILAITFTTKAATEMRERIVRALRDEEGGSTDHGRRLRELADAARERSARLGWSLETQPTRLRIETIDAFNRALALQLPLGARGAGSLAIAEHPRALYREAARRTLLDAQAHPRFQSDAGLLFERLDNDFARFEDLLTLMLAVRAHWLPHLLRSARLRSATILETAASDDAGLDLRARVEESLGTIVAERLEFATRLIPAALRQEGFALVGLATAARFALGDLSAGAWRAGAPRPGETATLPHWRALAQLALTGHGGWRASLTRREGFDSDDKAHKARAYAWLGDMSHIAGARELLRELALLPDPVLCADDAAALSALARVLQLAASELEVVFGEVGRVDYPYVAAAARRALTEEAEPTELALRLGAAIRHVLVDEFQDTSIEQCALLEALTAGWERDDGRTLFVVGDPMQSIYQFREAEVGLFLRARTHGLGTLPLEPLALTSNFRAAPRLVDWINHVFAATFAAQDDPRTSAVRYAPCIAARNDATAGTVQLHPTRPGDAVAEARDIATLVARMRERQPAARIAVLLSARPHAAPIVAALHALRVPVTGVDLVSLAELPIIRDLAALACALDHLGDRTAWLAVLRAPWCGLTLPEISVLIEGASTVTVWEAINDERRLADLSAGARTRLERTREVLAQSLAQKDRGELAEWLEGAWLRLGGPAACSASTDLEHARAFFTSVSRWAREPQWTGPRDLPELLEQLYAVHDEHEAHAVQIMTIHRAKGLEFDMVIVPGLGRRLRSDREPLLRWLELPRDARGSDLLMAPIPPPGRRGLEPLSEYVKSLQNRRSGHERARLLYVAATRARSELHMFGDAGRGGDRRHHAAPPSGTLLATLWPAVATQFLDATAQSAMRIAPEVRAPRTSTRLARLASDWVLPKMPLGPAVDAIAIASYEPPSQEEARRPDLPPAQAAVRVVRDHLRRCARRGRLPTADRAVGAGALRDRLSRLGYADAMLEECATQALALLESCLADPRLRWIFAPHTDVSSPLELTGIYEGRLTNVSIDRAFTDSLGVRWLVDFSAAAPNDASVESFLMHELQRLRADIAKRLALAGHLGSGTLRAAVYFPAVQALAEVP